MKFIFLFSDTGFGCCIGLPFLIIIIILLAAASIVITRVFNAQKKAKSGFNDIVSAANKIQNQQVNKEISKVDELEKLIKMKNEGHITQEEFEDMKKKL